jgi:hypothetical protein
VYKSFTGLGVKKGDTIHIGFTESPETFVNKEGKTVNYTDRFILGLREASGAPSRIEVKDGPERANRGQYDESRQAFGRRLAVHGFVNGMLAAGATIETVVKDLPALMRLEDAIDLALQGPLGPGEDLPTIQQDYSGGEDVDMSDVPF